MNAPNSKALSDNRCRCQPNVATCLSRSIIAAVAMFTQAMYLGCRRRCHVSRYGGRDSKSTGEGDLL